MPNPNGRCADGSEPVLYFADQDGDGDGNPRLTAVRCHRPQVGRWSTTGTDCDDTKASIVFGGPESCDGLDNNCDGVIDEGLTPQQPFYLDLDGDGFGQTSQVVSACAAPPGYVDGGADCSPFDAAKFPGAPESCNGLDDNCNGVPDAQEPPGAFADTDSPSHPFPCLTDQPGQCQAGVFRCEALSDAGVQRRCVALASPTREVCDGLDNNCDGTIDEQPACGGPASLLNVAGATYAAQRLTSTTNLATRCQKNEPGVAETATAAGTWSGGGQAFHVWSVEAPAGETWDLSNSNATLRVLLSAVASGVSPTRGAWGDPTNSDAINPVVYLCGSDSDIMRYRVASTANALKLNDTSFDRSLQLKGVGSQWLIGQGSGFDTTRVKRVELVLFTYATSFTITVAPDAGFSR